MFGRVASGLTTLQSMGLVATDESDRPVERLVLRSARLLPPQ